MFVSSTQPILIVLIVLAAFTSSVLFSFIITGNISNNSNVTDTIFQESSSSSSIKDSKGDTKLVALYKTNILPEVENYHDILSAYVNQISNDKIQLTIDLAGNANQNEKYETVYLWLIYYTASIADDGSPTGDRRDQLYTVIVPNFGAGSNFGNIEEGWYLSIFNNTNISYTLSLSKILDMPKDKVQVFIDPAFIGNPPSSFNYIVSAMIRVNSTFLDKPPDYIVDSVPNNYDSFWKRWFR